MNSEAGRGCRVSGGTECLTEVMYTNLRVWFQGWFQGLAHFQHSTAPFLSTTYSATQGLWGQTVNKTRLQ